DSETCRDEFFKTEKYMEDGCRFKRVTLKIGDRNMTALTRRSPEVDTVWTVEHLLKNTDDLKAYLELPDEVFAEQVNVADLVEEDKKLADRGVIDVELIRVGWVNLKSTYFIEIDGGPVDRFAAQSRH
ncbi:unnamed protein product, partial [marine sediment metagenome]